MGRAIRAAAPNEWYAGPGTSQIDLEFIEECCQAGLLQYWSALTVHPYRQTAPETVTAEYARLRQLIRRYAPPGAAIPIISGEWGYSSAWRGVDQTRQGKMLPRQWLTNLANRIPLSIWYDWHDDGTDPKEAEHHFGTVAHAYFPDREPVYDPKPAYLAARALTQALKGFFYSKRLDVGRDEDYVLLFGWSPGPPRRRPIRSRFRPVRGGSRPAGTAASGLPPGRPTPKGCESSSATRRSISARNCPTTCCAWPRLGSALRRKSWSMPRRTRLVG